MSFPSAAPITDQVTGYVTDQVTDRVKQLLSVLNTISNRNELMVLLNIKHAPTFRTTYIKPALELGLVEMTIPDKPKSQFQKYKLTALGKQYHQEFADQVTDYVTDHVNDDLASKGSCGFYSFANVINCFFI